MKKKLALLFAATFAIAATSIAQTTFGVRAGVNFQNINGKDYDGSDLDNKLKVGFNIGANAEIPVAPEFYLQPGILFTTKGAKFSNDSKLNISYLEIPVNFLYKGALGSGKLLLGVGPYIAFGLGGKVKGDNYSRDLKFKNEVTLTEFAANPSVKRIDAGGNLLAGYEFSNKLSFQLNAQLGMLKINSKITNPNMDGKYRNTGFGISAGYRF